MKTTRRANGPLVNHRKAGCATKCTACPDALDVMHALIGADLESLTVQELTTFLEFESKYREEFGQEGLFKVEAEIARLGKQGARGSSSRLSWIKKLHRKALTWRLHLLR